MKPEKDYSDDYVKGYKTAYIVNNYKKSPSKEKSTTKTFAIFGIVFSVIGLGLDLWDVYGYNPRLAINILFFFSVFLCNLNNFNVISTILTNEHNHSTISHPDQN